MVAISFPASPSVNDTFTSNGKTWQWNGTFWSLVVSGASVADGSVSTAKIADSAITAAKIADGTVVAAEIASNAITTVKINDAAVTTAKINDAAVTTAKVNDSAITTAKILDANITTAKIASSAVTTDKIASDAVTTAKILDANVTTAKVAANAITQAKLASNLSAVTVTTTANRDTDIPSPFTGQLIVLTDTKKVQLWDGTAWLNITMAPPETPTSLSAIESTTSVAISFTAGAANGSAITNYKYALSTDGGSTYGSFTALSPADFTTPITVSGLSMNTTYHVKLKAVNDLGDSVASAAVSFTTEGVPGAPTSLSASNVTSSTADIAFTAGAANGASITNYKFAVSTDNITYGAYTALDPVDASTPVTVTGLTPGTLQYIKLKAVNSNGDSAASAAVSTTTLNTLNVTVLAVSGGRGANVSGGGGGWVEQQNLTPAYGSGVAVQVGSGGSRAGGVGTASSFGSFTTGTSGGGQGGYPGAGDAAVQPGAGNGGAGINGQSGGGGGGGGTSGQNGSNSNGGTGGSGGAGTAHSITGSSVYYGGGGGGTQSGGAGAGGGASGTTSGFNDGGANTGGGAGGGYHNAGGNGGSGVVILRYLTSAGTITIGAGLTGSTSTDGSHKVTTITAGTGNVSWA